MSASNEKSPHLLDWESRANVLTHAVGAGIFLSGLALLVVLSVQTSDPWKIVSFSVFGLSLVLLYGASTLYHSVRSPRLRRILRILDHVSINILIAGTYTPYLMVNLRETGWGWPLLGTIWGLALIGVVSDLFFTGRFKKLSTLLYILMGWVIVVAMRPLIHNLSMPAVVLLFAGGVAYTGGATFYILDKRIPFGHAVWHLFVLTGSICQFLSVILGVLPR
jgi:hemolysin III